MPIAESSQRPETVGGDDRALIFACVPAERGGDAADLDWIFFWDMV
jgi:hypothetical protein